MENFACTLIQMYLCMWFFLEYYCFETDQFTNNTKKIHF